MEELEKLGLGELLSLREYAKEKKNYWQHRLHANRENKQIFSELYPHWLKYYALAIRVDFITDERIGRILGAEPELEKAENL
jgi:hypothetical protein